MNSLSWFFSLKFDLEPGPSPTIIKNFKFKILFFFSETRGCDSIVHGFHHCTAKQVNFGSTLRLFCSKKSHCPACKSASEKYVCQYFLQILILINVLAK